MDCSKIYGKKIVINEIVALSKTDFKEKAHKEINANQYSNFNHRTHTWSTNPPHTIIDGCLDLPIFKHPHLLKYTWYTITNKLYANKRG